MLNSITYLTTIQCFIFRIQGIPSVTALKYKDGLQIAVGTKSGQVVPPTTLWPPVLATTNQFTRCFTWRCLQVILYDLRSNKPLLIKDHMYGLPIKNIEYHENPDLVISCDTRIVKLWHRNTVSFIIIQ